MRNSFVLYTDYQDQIDMLTIEQRGWLLTAIMAYASGLDLPEMDGMTKMAFGFIRTGIDRDTEKYRSRCEQNRKIAIEREQKKRQSDSTNVHERARTFTSESERAPYDNDNDSDNDNDLKEKTPKGVQKKSGFQPPTPQQVREYCEEKGYTNVDAEKFCDFYESKGWYVGKTKMKDWKAAVRNWSRSQRQEKTAEGRQGKTVNRFNNFEQRDYDWLDLERKILAAQEVH